MESIVDRTALLKRLREKVLKGVTLAEEGPSVAELFLLMRDLNYLHLQLLRELGRLISADNLPMEVLPSLLEMEGLRADDMARGKTLQGRSDAELLQAAGVLPLICLHRFPSLESLFPEQKVLDGQDRKERIIALLLREMRALSEKKECSKSTR